MYLKASPPSATPHHGLQGPPLATLLVGRTGMNFFRLLGDVSHLVAILILLLKIWKTRSCAGISGKSQILFLVVFVTRYLDLVTNFVSVYNTVMKVFFIVSAAATVYLMYVKFRATYDGNHDSFRVEFLLAPVAILAMVLNNEFTVMEVLWTFSIYLESVAILPLLVCPGLLPGALHPQLDLPLPLRG